MNEDDNRKMDKYGIKSETLTVYYYKGYRYEHLQDAINYAEIDRAGLNQDEAHESAAHAAASLATEK